MPSVSITRRKTKAGEARFVVRYRRGGRFWPVEHGGSFAVFKEAKARRDLIGAALAAGRDPREAIRPKPDRSLGTGRQLAEAYKESRVDLSAKSLTTLSGHLLRFNKTFGARVLEDIGYVDVQAFVNANRDLEPSSLTKYVQTARQIFDFAEIEPNPARDRRVKLPRVERAEIIPPTGRQVLAILDHSPRKRRLPLVTIEQTGARIGEIATLVWGDVDARGCQFRLRAAETKSRRARWVQVPDWLMAHIEETCPLEDRTAERPVFLGFTPNLARRVMARACTAAKIPAYSPHDLRHRRISLWHGQGVPTKQLSERVGHARASVTLDVYSHVMPLEEISPEQFAAAIAGSGWRYGT
jgi:integrase